MRMLVRDIKLPGGNSIRMRASALIPRMYRAAFGRDMIRDLSALQKSVSDSDGNGLASVDLEIFENLAWVMAKHADPSVPDNPDEWLETIDGVMPIYEILPEMMDLLAENNKTTASAAKK